MSIWGKSRPNQWFESYCTNCDEAAQNFKNVSLLANILIRSSQIQFNIPSFDICWGEPCRFLAALAEITTPNLIVDIGTSCGGSAKAFLDFSPKKANVVTFDVMPWNTYTETYLKETDFFSGRLIQHVEDLSCTPVFEKHQNLLALADLIYCDAPKDGVFEYTFLDKLSKVKMNNKQRYLVLDDIRFKNMAALWRDIASPKFDATSFGHWSGTGLVDISEGLKLKV